MKAEVLRNLKKRFGVTTKREVIQRMLEERVRSRRVFLMINAIGGIEEVKKLSDTELLGIALLIAG